MEGNIKFLSVNCRGMASKQKRLDLFKKWKEEKYDIIMLQDTHWTNETIMQIKEEWACKQVSSTYKSNSRGTSILFNDTLDFSIGRISKDTMGNYVILEIIIPDNISIVIGSIYGPNDDNPEFYCNIAKTISEYENPNILIGGDWNSTRNFKLDNNNYLSQNNMKATKAIDKMCEKFNLKDVWRLKNPDKKIFTWMQGISGKQSRLDYFLCNEELISISNYEEILYKYRSDHSPITLTLEFNPFKRGKGLWKMNNSLLKNEEFTKLIKREINNFKDIHVATPYHPDFSGNKLHGLEQIVDPILFWDALLANLRGIIINFSRKLNKKKKEKKTRIINRIESLEKIINKGNANLLEYTQLKNANEELIELRQEELKGSLIRSRAEWLNLGEKPSRFFLNLENRNRVNKTLNELKVDDNTILKDPVNIRNAMRDFYKKLYSKPNNIEESDYNPKIEPKKISENEKLLLDLPITQKELDEALKCQKNNKSPGPDGFSPEFFKYFWAQLGPFFLQYINECQNRSKFSPTFLDGIITCLPKTGKQRNLIKNWRPISLLNTTYKIISSCITNRLRPILKNIISPEQNGFLEDRSINDCTRLMHDIINECNNKGLDGLILLVDFEKAFDSISWEYIAECLKHLNFGNNFINWIKMFQNGARSSILLNGHQTEPFELERSCRQGDPISPYIFILCTEFLTQAFKNETRLEGIKIHNKQHKLNQYADDTSVFMKAREENLKLSLRILYWFYVQSGLKINMTKTKIVRIGKIRESDRRYCKENNLDWVTSFTCLGIKYDALDMLNITEINIKEKLPQIRGLIQSWGNRNITPLGRSIVWKSLILSKLTHILMSLPSPRTSTIKELEDMCIDFIWNGKRHQIKKDILYQQVEHGGLNLINLVTFNYSLKITWIRKLTLYSPEWAEFAEMYRVDYITQTDILYHNTLIKKCKNPFWRDVILSYKNWYEGICVTSQIEDRNKLVWGNPTLKLPFNNMLYSQNFRYTSDFFKNGLPLSHAEVEALCNHKLMFTEYFSIINSIQRLYNMNEHIMNYNIEIPVNLIWLLKDKKGTKSLRYIFSNKAKPQIPIGQQKWQNDFQNDNIEWKKLYLLSNKCNLNAKMVFFQYQILHKTLITNRKLKMFNLSDTEMCDNCDKIETIEHLLYDCPYTTTIWEIIWKWLRKYITDQLYLGRSSILLGDQRNTILVNQIFIIFKYEIYRKKWTNKTFNIHSIKHILNKQMEAENYNAKISNRTRFFLGKWSPIYNWLTT